jgi:phage gp46-like protein
MTDVLLCQTVNNGDINLEDGVVELSPGLETAAYLSMFGGADWWGNIDEDVPARRYDARTQALLETLNPSSRNLLRIEEAAKADLAWFISEKVASSVEAVASIPALNKLNLLVTIRAEGQEAEFTYVENWKASA